MLNTWRVFIIITTAIVFFLIVIQFIATHTDNQTVAPYVQYSNGKTQPCRKINSNTWDCP